MNEIGDRLRKLRRERNLTQQGLAAASGVPQTTISKIERGKQHPAPRTVQAFAEALQLPPAVILGSTTAHDAPQPLDERSLPMFGTVPAGAPSQSQEQLTLWPVLKHQWGKERYVLRVGSDSMYPKYQRGDLVLVEYLNDPDPRLVDGKTCVCLYRGDATMKVVEVQRGQNGPRVILKGATADVPVIVLEDDDDFTIQGRVLKLIDRDD